MYTDCTPARQDANDVQYDSTGPLAFFRRAAPNRVPDFVLLPFTCPRATQGVATQLYEIKRRVAPLLIFQAHLDNARPMAGAP